MYLYLSPKASDAAQALFAFLNEGGGRDALLAGGLVPRPEPEAIEAEVAAASTPLDPNRSAPQSWQAEKTEVITPAPGEGDVSHSVASESPAGEADFATWATAHVVPIGLISLGVVAVAVAMGSLGMKRARHRNEVMRRYRP